MLLSFFLFDWLSDYINTSKYDMTLSIELLGILAVGIIAFAVLGIVTTVVLIIDYFKKRGARK